MITAVTFILGNVVYLALLLLLASTWSYQSNNNTSQHEEEERGKPEWLVDQILTLVQTGDGDDTQQEGEEVPEEEEEEQFELINSEELLDFEAE